jgi:branched-chain amino acid transport system substrate-binding protein
MSLFRDKSSGRWLAWAAAAALAFLISPAPAFAADPIKIGQVAALSGPSAQSGEAMTRGLQIAIDEINAKGGLLKGRQLRLIQRDDESNPPKGLIAARELIFKEKVAAFFGGLDTPVSLAIVPVANREAVPFIGIWAAGTNITHNGAKPNFVFRVSAVDALVDVRLLKHAEKLGSKKAGLILINNPWGESNEKGLKAAAEANKNLAIVGIEKFENNDVDLVPQLTRLKQAGADVLILVGNAAPGAQVMKSRERMAWKVPVVSHWGISGGRFPELAGPSAGDAQFVQTHSFFGEQNAAGKRLIAALVKKYPEIKGPADIFSPVGTANAYDAMHLLAMAIEKAGSTDGNAIRQALESLGTYEGLIKTYRQPFTADNHDALGPDDYVMVRYVGNDIHPVN